MKIDKTIRKLDPRKNKINWKARNVAQLIKWENHQYTSPPLLKDYSDVEIENFIKTPPKLIFNFPSHTQNVERHIPLVANATERITEKEREGYILSQLESRKLNPIFCTKSQYNFQ